jgi:trehalose 6-phosphate phosphatase
MLGADVKYVGLYGRDRGSEPAPTGAFLSIIPEVVAAASGVQGAEVEEKGPHVAVHYRAASDPVAARRTLIRLLSPLAERAGCRILEGKRVVEIQPEDAPSKGQAVERLVREGGLGMVLYAGDDLGDMSAFAALDRLAPEGVEGIKVAVRTTETPDEVVSTGDLVVDGPRALVALLAKVADAAASVEG